MLTVSVLSVETLDHSEESPTDTREQGKKKMSGFKKINLKNIQRFLVKAVP